MVVFGPVPSRRLGKSLGVNNIPPKFCSYNCIYCQVGKTQPENLIISRKEFYEPDWLIDEIFKKINELKLKNIKFDYITFVPDGEPTLDINLGIEIEKVRNAGYKTAVITNSSLLWLKKVRNEIMNADYVSVKVDSVSKKKWKQINRANNILKLELILEGLMDFSNEFKGTLTTETMILYDINDGSEDITELINYMKRLNAKINYLMVPIRPPAEERVKIPPEEKIVEIYDEMKRHLNRVELLTAHEDNDFSTAGKLENEILSITSVHPMREESVKKLLNENGKDWDIIRKLISDRKLKETEYNSTKYYTRIFQTK